MAVQHRLVPIHVSPRPFGCFARGARLGAEKGVKCFLGTVVSDAPSAHDSPQLRWRILAIPKPKKK